MQKTSNIYILKHDCHGHAAGILVYDPIVYDYNLARDDSRYTGIEHLSVTRDPSGGYPVFSVARTSLELLS